MRDGSNIHGALKIAAWGLWVFVLLATPYSLMANEAPPYLSSAYAYLAVGLVLGIACSHCLGGWAPYGMPRPMRAVLAVLGASLTAYVVVPEWAVFCSGAIWGIVPVSPGLEVPLLGQIVHVYDGLPSGSEVVYNLCLLVCGTTCSFVGSLLGGAREGSGAPKVASERFARSFSLAILALAFLLGLARPGFWTSYVLAYGPDSFMRIWYASAVSFGAFVPTLAKYLALTVELVLCGACYQGKRVSESPGARGTSSVLLAFACGEIAWNLIARCVGTETLLYSACGPLGIAVPILEAGFAALLVASYFCRKWTETRQADLGARSSLEEVPETDGALDEAFAAWGFAASEREACQLMLAGKSSKESAEILGLKPSTVRNYLQRSYKKAGVTNGKELKESLEEAGLLQAGSELPVLGGGESDAGQVAAKGPSQQLVLFLIILALFVGGLLVALPFRSSSFVELWRACHSLTIALGIGCALIGMAMLELDPEREEGARRLEDTLAFAAGVAPGCMLEELLRNSDALFFAGLQGVFYLGLLLIGASNMRKRRSLGVVPILLLLCGAVILAAAGYPLAALAFLGFSTCLLATASSRRQSGGRGESAFRLVLGLGVGLLAARLLTDYWYGFLLWRARDLEEHGSGQLLVSSMPAVMAIAAILGLVAVALLLSIWNTPAGTASEPALEERRCLYLASQGLSEQEAMVVLKIAEGYTGFQIAYESHYSYGSVNTWRANAYRKLGVHSKAELADLLIAQVS